MSQRNGFQHGDMTTEAQAIVDLVDANVSPIAAAEAWEAEITARQRGEREEPAQPDEETLRDVIDRSTALA